MADYGGLGVLTRSYSRFSCNNYKVVRKQRWKRVVKKVFKFMSSEDVTNGFLAHTSHKPRGILLWSDLCILKQP